MNLLKSIDMKCFSLTLVLMLSCLLINAQHNSFPIEKYAHIKSNGKYTMLANLQNRMYGGEEVDISTDYFLCKYAVTNQEWQIFINATGKRAPKYWINNTIPIGKEYHPVVWVSYNDALDYCKWLETLYPEYTFRIPSQGEWEFAAVGNNRTAYVWGNDTNISYYNGEIHSKFNYNGVISAYILRKPNSLATYIHKKSIKLDEQYPIKDIISINDRGNVKGWVNHREFTGFIYTDLYKKVNDVGGFTCPVDSFQEGKSASGCYNMSGNCWEWTSTIEIATNGAEKGLSVNIIKGGSWYATSRSCRISYRGEGRKPNGRYATVGIRVLAERK